MGKIFGALVFYVFGLFLVSCSTSKTAATLSNSDPYSDSIAKILENKGWPKEVIAVFRPFQFGTYSYSVTGDSLFLKANLRNDIVQKSWYVKETGLFIESLNEDGRRLCKRSKENFTIEECIVFNEKGDAISVQNFKLEEDRVHLKESREYDYKGDLKSYLIQADSIHLNARFFNKGMPHHYDARYIDSTVYIDDSTSILYWRQELINGGIYFVNGFEYQASKVVMNKMTITLQHLVPETINVGDYKEYMLYSRDVSKAPKESISKLGQYDTIGQRTGFWRTFDLNGKVLNESNYP